VKPVERCEVLVVGGGPAGSTCAWALRRLGVDVVLLDRSLFPRDKVCAGWITPQIVEELDLDLGAYGEERTLQPIRGFCVSRMGDRESAIDFGRVVSFGIRRCEFDDYLLTRSGARLRLGEPLRTIERTSEGWRINGEIEARIVVGAGGHFCPVARALAPSLTHAEPIIAAQEVELALEDDASECRAVRPEVQHLFFTRDLVGYGWVVRKGDYLNVGLGRRDSQALSSHVAELVGFLAERGRIPRSFRARFRGHAYLLYGDAQRPLTGGGFLLVGDAAGLAYPRSGEGIRPAVESGLLAARAIFDAKGRYDAEGLSPYEQTVEERFGSRTPRLRFEPTRLLPERLRGPVAGRLLSMPWFARHVVVSRWFLHMDTPPLPRPGLVDA
jgi:geranylgeranyl reductase family protein